MKICSRPADARKFLLNAQKWAEGNGVVPVRRSRVATVAGRTASRVVIASSADTRVSKTAASVA